MKLLGVVLAGGLSRRMGGGDKSLIEVAGTPLIKRTVDRLKPQVEDIIINANGDASRFDFLRYPVLADSIEGFAGPLAGVLAALDHAVRTGGYDAVLSVAADTPSFPPNLAAELEIGMKTQRSELVLAKSNGRVHPVFGLWRTRLQQPLREFLERGETRKILAFTDSRNSTEVEFQSHSERDPFFNINTKEELAEFEVSLKENR